jgi:hypothetical protein
VSEFISPLNRLHFQSCPYEQGFFEQDAPFHCSPIDIGEKRLNVFGPISRLVIQEIRVFPNVQYKDWNKTRNITHFMQ